MKAGRLNVYALRTLNDAELEAELASIERRIERLADATWPAAPLQRAELEDVACEIRAERRRV